MTEQPSWAGDVPSYTAVRGPLPAPQWDEVSQNTLDDLRLRLRESVTESILMAVRGFFIPGPLGAAFEQLVDWSSEVLNAQNLLDAMNGNYTGDNGVLLAIEVIFGPLRGLVAAIGEPLRMWLTWMWNLFSNVTPNPEPTGLGANVLVPLFKWLDSLWEGFGDVIENVFAFVLNLFKPLAPASGGAADPDEFWDGVASTKTGANLLPDPRIDKPSRWKQAGLAVSTAFSNTTYTSTTTQSLEFTGNGAARSFYWPTGFLGLPYDIGTWPDRIYYVECYVYLPAANPNTTATVKMFGKASIIPFGNGDDVAAMTFTAPGTWGLTTLTNPAKGGAGWTRMFGYFKIPTLRNGFTAGITFTASTSHKIYVDDLAIIDVTEAVTTNNKLYGRPTPADTIDAGTKLTGQIPDAQVPQITTTWNELYDAFDNSITPPGTQRTVAQVRTASATVRGSAVAGENKSAAISTKLYNSQTPADTILTAAIPNGVDATKLTGTIDDGRIPILSTAKIPTLGRSKLLNPDFSNALQDGGFETGTAGTSTGSWGTSGGGVIATIADPKVGGTKVLSVASSGAILDTYMLPAIPVSPAEVWYGECWVRKTTAGGTGTYQLGATVYKDGASPQYPSFLTADVSTLTQNVWTKISGFVTIPDAINQLTVRPSVRNSVAAGTTIQFDNIVVRKATQYELADSAVTNAKLVNGDITGAKLAANSIDAGTKLTGTIVDAQIPVISTNKIPELDPLKVTGLPSLASSTNDSGVVTLRTVESSLVDLATDVATLKVDREVATNQGKTISVSFVQLPNTNDLPTTGTQTWSTQYLTGSGPTFGVTSGKATWKSSGTRTAKVLYRGTGTRQLLSTGTAGTFTLTLGATTTGPLAHNATAAAVQTALGAANFTVGGTNALTGLTLTPVASTTTVAGISPISGALSITSSVTGGVATLSDGGDTTLTDFQSLRGVLADPPSIFGTGYSTAFTALARVSQDGMSYVFARAYWAALGNLRGEIGYCNGGVETIWQPNIALTWSTELTFRLGVDDNPRAYQVFSGSTLVTRYDEGYANFGAFPATGRVTGRTYVDNTGNRLVVTATGGSFTLTAGGATTGAIAFNASQATVAASLNAALNLAYSGNAAAGVVYATVSGTAANTAGTPGGLVVTFTSKVKGLTVGNVNMTVNPALLTGGSATVANRYTWNGTTAFVASTATSGSGAASPLGPTSRRFGAEVRTNGSNNSGTISSVAVSDNPPVVYAGSVARMVRLNEATTTLASGENALTSNFFDDVEYESLDIDATLTDGSFTVTKSKMYMVTARIRLSSFFTSNCYVVLQRWNAATSTWAATQDGDSAWPFDSFHNTQGTNYALTGVWLQYLNAGDKVRLATWRENGSSSVLRGLAAGTETYFSISALQ